MKKCWKCNKKKKLVEFIIDKRNPSGYTNYCKKCYNKECVERWNKNPTLYKNRKKWELKNKEKVRLYKKKYADSHKKELKNKQMQLLKNNLNYRLSSNLRHRVWSALKGFLKSKRTFDLIGCSIDDLKTHIESQFKDGMSWENYGRGGWHIDHIKPCAAFNLSNSEEQKECFSYLNLQPLWEYENLSKNAKILS
jgi:hypothetical protein